MPYTNMPANNSILVLGLNKVGREEIASRLLAAGYQVLQAPAPGRGEAVRADLVILAASDEEDLVGGCGAVRRHPDLKVLPLLAIVPEKYGEKVDLGAGMDDLLLAPWRGADLLLRVKMALWKNDRTESSQLLKIGDISIDQDNYTVRLRGSTLDLTLKEYELLCYLVGNPGRVFTRAALLNRVWGYEYFGGTRTVDVHIRRLRAKLGDWGESMIQTVRGVGYRFSA
jgi:two-component system, OmpR family, alkaline phosphatase synthesis response regulator PhoP